MPDYGLSAGISAWSNAAMDIAATKYDKKQSELAYWRSIRNRDYMNQYNSPEMQMQRLKAAGLNPNLMYPRGNMGNQPTQSVKYDQPKASVTPKNMQIGGVESYMDLRLKQSNINHIDEVTRKQRMANDLFEGTKEIKWESQLRNLDRLKYLNNKHKQEGDLMELVISAKKNDISIQNFEIGLNKLGLSKKDHVWLRGLVTNKEKIDLFDDRLRKSWKDRGLYDYK